MEALLEHFPYPTIVDKLQISYHPDSTTAIIGAACL